MTKAQSDHNPFVIAPGEFWADREKLWTRIADSIEIARHTRNNEIIVLTGGYGCGTTHTLKYLKKYLREKGAFASYVTITPSGTLRALYEQFIRDLDSHMFEELVSETVVDLIKEARIRSPEFSSMLEEVIRRLIRNPSMSRLSFSSGERQILRESGIEDKFPTFADIWLSLIFKMSKPDMPVFILIDEFDVGFPDLSALLNDLRRFYDDSLFGLCLIFGLKGEPKDVQSKLGGALYSRMSLQPLHLYPISQDEGVEFLKAILNRKGNHSSTPFHPFTEGAVKTLVQLSCPTTPRRLLRIASYVFETAQMEGVSIDKDFVLRMAEKFGQISIPIQAAEGKTIERRDTGTIVPAFQDIIEFDADNLPHLLVIPDKLSAKEVIGLLLFSKKTEAISLDDLTKLVSRNWNKVTNSYVSANIAQMKPLILAEGTKRQYKYRLSGAGLSWIENELLPRLKKEKQE